MATYQEERIKDKEKEEAFLKAVGKKEVSTELELMLKSYGERLEHLVKLRFDVEILNYLIIAEPNQKSHLTDKSKAELGLRRNRRAIAILREQILEKLGKNGKTNKLSKTIQKGKEGK